MLQERTLNRERLPVSVSSAVFIEDSEGRLLLLKKKLSENEFVWAPPSGGMKPHEDPTMTAKREAREEIGVDVNLLNLIRIYPIDRGDNATGLGFVFRGKIVEGEVIPDEFEIIGFNYFSVSELERLIKENKLYKPEYNIPAIRDWIDGKSYPMEVISAIALQGFPSKGQ